jgi:hypothetical protein
LPAVNAELAKKVVYKEVLARDHAGTRYRLSPAPMWERDVLAGLLFFHV